MEGSSYRGEAERWLTIAEKLLTARDFQGAKTFAIRARDSDPRLLEFADQIIVVADTIVAGESRIINYTGDSSLDYYAILQLPRLSQCMELTATQYRKFAMLLNPTRNRLSFADHAFRLVSEAWNVFSNPSKKAMYDNELQVSQLGQLGQIGQFGQMGMPGQEYPLGQSSQGNERRSPRNSRDVEEDRVTQPVPTRPNRFQSPPKLTEPIRPIAQHKAAEPIRPVPQPRPADPVRPQVQPRPADPVRPQAQPRPADPVRPQAQIKAPEPIRPTPQPVSTEPSQPNPSESNRPAPQRTSAESNRPATQRTSSESNLPATKRTSPVSTRSTRLVDVPIATESEVPSFWTACPYCYILYEYPKVYEECAIRCQKCKRAFHAATIPSPPITGKDTYFCSWGYFPLGFSGGKGGGGFGNNWSPVSAMFAAPFPGREQPKKTNQPKRPAPASTPKVIYDDDVYINLSDPSGDESDSDDDWDERRKKAKTTKGKSTPGKNTKRSQNERLKKVILQNGAGGGNVQGDAVGKGEGSSGKKRGTKDLGRLDLNVMFSNEVEEAVPGVSEGNGAAHGVEDNIEGIGFFEGLDEFLSSLPILSVVGDDKVKAS
ncbi:uncharacterized protein [Euphorbia lathyris]|uniref:uncharacterized protein n=1 Tax=Euphorbia lathyris TaxID=212925 RepID=UPI00331341A5